MYVYASRAVRPERRILKLVGLYAMYAVVASAQSPLRDLTEVSLEDLMNIEVTSVSKKEQKLVASPAAIFVITQEDIRRSGLGSIPELLRMVPGVEVAQIQGNQWAITARGFNGQFSKNLLVLVDGRSVYLPSDSGVYWDEQDTLIEDIDRIEVIRGPGATLWGANAVNGVINIITKTAENTQGGLVTARAGNGDHVVSGGRYGGQLGNSGHYRIYSKYFRRHDLTKAEGNHVPSGDWSAIRGGFRTDWKLSGRDALTVEGDLFHATAGLDAEIPVLTPPFEHRVDFNEKTAGGNLLMNWSHRNSDTSKLTVKAYFDHSQKDTMILDEHDNRVNFEFQHEWMPAERHELVWGLGFRFDASTFHNSPTLSFRNRHGALYSAFLQDEIRLAPGKLSLIAGMKFEHNPFTGAEVQPNVRFLWTPSSRSSVWLAASRAVRTPSYFELDGQINLAAFPTPGGLPAAVRLYGSSEIPSVTLRAHEAGYRTQVSKRLTVDWSGFYNVYAHLGTFEPAAPFVTADPQPFHLVIPKIASDRMRGESLGTEVAATLDATKRWRINAAYSRLSLQLHMDPTSGDTYNEALEGQSPKHKVQVRSKFDLTRCLQFDANMFYVGALPALSVPGYTRFDARLGWRPRSPIELSIGGQNLQGGRHLEFISEGPFAPARVGRTLYVNATFQF